MLIEALTHTQARACTEMQKYIPLMDVIPAMNIQGLCFEGVRGLCLCEALKH